MRRDQNPKPIRRKNFGAHPAKRLPSYNPLLEMLVIHGLEDWQDTNVQTDWLIKFRALASEYGCKVVFDPRHHWKDSYCELNGGQVFVGGYGDQRFSCTAALHELGHHILIYQHHSPRNLGEREKAAWAIAQEIALKHRLPLVSSTKRRTLFSYEYRRLLESQRGSKGQTKMKPPAKRVQLKKSKRGSMISTGAEIAPAAGKKGKRFDKRFIKRATKRAERRQKIPRDEG